jgi:hypothetical protein
MTMESLASISAKSLTQVVSQKQGSNKWSFPHLPHTIISTVNEAATNSHASFPVSVGGSKDSFSFEGCSFHLVLSPCSNSDRLSGVVPVLVRAE